jgi:hypothetical protein
VCVCVCVCVCKEFMITWDEDEGDCETLWNVVDSQRGRYEGAEVGTITTAEADTDAQALGERVHGHDRDDDQNLLLLRGC